MIRMFFFVAALVFSGVCSAQNGGTASSKDRLKVTVSNKQLTLWFQNKPIALADPQALDSCLKRIMPGMGHPSVEVESEDGTDRERMRQVAVVLESYHCPVTGVRKR